MSSGVWLRRFSLLLLASMLLLAACGSDEKQGSKSEPVPDASENTKGPPVAPPVAVTQASWAPDALEELLAPIALYPDQLLTQILAASVNAQEVLDGGNWLLNHQDWPGKELDAAAQQAGFGPAMRALLHVPDVVDLLCQQIDWTRQVGAAFSSDQKSVLDAVQRLRAQAAQVGNLRSTPQQTVETTTSNEQTIIEVKPADPQIVYVPQYNPQVVYTTPPPAQPAPAATSSDDDTVSTETAVAAGLIGFGVGALIGGALADDDDDYCCYPNWGHSTVVVGARPFYPPAYAYRPAYGAGFRPAYGYNPPAGYRHNSGNYQRGRQGNTTNIAVDNSNYFNRFDNNQNLRAGTTQSPLGTQSNRSTATQGGRTDNWKGQSTYQGARNDATAQRMNQAAGMPGTSPRAQTRSDPRLADASTGRASNSGERTVRDTQPTSRAPRAANADRGFGDEPSLQSRQAKVERPAADVQMPDMQRQDMQRPSSDTPRSAPDIQRPEPSAQRADTAAAASAQERSRDSAFSGARDSGSFERSASARGRASAGGRGGGGRRR